LAILSKGCDASNDCTYWWKDFGQHHWQQGVTVGAVSAGALLGSHTVLMYLSAAVCSRRTALRMAAVLYLVGTACNILSGTVLAESSSSSSSSMTAGWLTLVMGRLIFGMGVGFCMRCAPPYMAEMVPSKTVLGAVVSAKEAVIVLGIVAGYFAGYILFSSSFSIRRYHDHDNLHHDHQHHDHLHHRDKIQHHDNDHGRNNNHHWTHLYAVSFCLAIPMLVLTFFIPRSKRWLLMHGMRQEAQESMRFVYNGNIQPEFDKMVGSIEANNRLLIQKQKLLHSTAGSSGAVITATATAALGRLFSSHSRPALTAAMGLLALQQFSGQLIVPMIQDYSPTFGVFACFVLLAAIFVHRHVSETARLTLEEIQKDQLMMTGGRGVDDKTTTVSSLEHSPLIEIQECKTHSSTTTTTTTTSGMEPSSSSLSSHV
jgi:MFS family permease